MHDVFKAEYQRNRYGRLFTEGQNGKAWSHIADIAIGRRQSMDCAVRYGHAADNDGQGKDNCKDGIGGQQACQDEVGTRQFLDRGSGQQFEKQCRQGKIDDKNIQPAHGVCRLANDAGRYIAKKNQAKQGEN